MTKLDEFLLPNAPTCIVACAATNARLWISHARFGDWRLLTEMHDSDAARQEKTFASDRPGRAFDSHGSGRHAMAASESGRKHEVRSFARQLADYLNSAVAAGDFEHIVLIAAPAFLGYLRTELSQVAKRAVVLAEPKDLTDLEVDQIRKYFK